MWNRGFGRLQCDRKPWGDTDLYKRHLRAPHGRVRGPIPNKKLQEFRAASLRPPKESTQWYARHLMWRYASELRPDLESLNETDDERPRDERGEKVFKLKNDEYERCLKKINKNLKLHNQKREQRKYEVGAGVRTREDRLGASGRFGTDRERYNGRNGGQRFRWYSRPVFNRYLSRAGASEASCTERQCMDALAATSDELRKYPMVTDNLTPFAGPQCFPHLDKASTECRLHANQRLKTEDPGSEGGAAPPQVAPAPGRACPPCTQGCWLQCDRCSKWRLLMGDEIVEAIVVLI